MAMDDKERWILGIAGTLASLGLGYLIWKHENAISQQQAAAQAAAQQANDAAYAQQLDQVLAVGGGVAQQAGAGYVGSPFPTGSTIDPTGGTAANPDLAAILSAFFPQGTSTATGNGSGASPAQPTQPAPVTSAPLPYVPTNPVGPAKPTPALPVVTTNPVGPSQPVSVSNTIAAVPHGGPAMPKTSYIN